VRNLVMILGIVLHEYSRFSDHFAMHFVFPCSNNSHCSLTQSCVLITISCLVYVSKIYVCVSCLPVWSGSWFAVWYHVSKWDVLWLSHADTQALLLQVVVNQTQCWQTVGEYCLLACSDAFLLLLCLLTSSS